MKPLKKTNYKQFILVPKSYLESSEEAKKQTTLCQEICSDDKRRINHMSKFKALHEFQKPLQCLTPESFLDYVNGVIPQDHLCRLVKEIVWRLETVSIEEKYTFLGQRTYHPKLLLSLLFYGYATGTRSSRKLEEKCLSDHIYIFLMGNYGPDHRTISDFRKNNLQEIERYFVEIVRIFQELGFTNVGKIYILESGEFFFHNYQRRRHYYNRFPTLLYAFYFLFSSFANLICKRENSIDKSIHNSINFLNDL